MKAARLVVLGVAIAAGGLAALLASREDEKPPVPAPVVQLETVDVLIAQRDIGMGHSVTPGDMKWQMWPTQAAGPTMIRKTDRPNAMEELTGSIARGTFQTGEPIQDSKLIKASGSGYMAAVLPSGMRAISTEISPETAAAGFILPGDRVDVILSRTDKAAAKVAGYDVQVSETILRNVRVLAIDQTVEEKNGQKVVVGKTATLELASRQTEKLALARQRGTISLVLRSIVDASGKNDNTKTDDDGDADSGINIIRFGINK